MNKFKSASIFCMLIGVFVGTVGSAVVSLAQEKEDLASSIDAAQKLSAASGRPIFAIAGIND